MLGAMIGLDTFTNRCPNQQESPVLVNNTKNHVQPQLICILLCFIPTFERTYQKQIIFPLQNVWEVSHHVREQDRVYKAQDPTTPRLNTPRFSASADSPGNLLTKSRPPQVMMFMPQLPDDLRPMFLLLYVVFPILMFLAFFLYAILCPERPHAT